MEKYKILGLVGEGSFGRVYKGQVVDTNEIVALKMIRKCGRPENELTSLRSECEIQRHLFHPNIIKMIVSFETESDIIVITEYADRELYKILGEEGYFEEEPSRRIVCDLVSALYYLHSHRVLHRDLKPQNVLLDENGVAKLCDFGFARNMSTGTHVLTSIKGTPLYMAPELIEESPYDHNADLWSLGCIFYEMLVGTPPFTTTSILHLVQLLRYEPVKWPDFVSPDCLSFLQGLLEKSPLKRLTWPYLLEHPFVKGSVLILDKDANEIPFTTPMSASQMRAKEVQKRDLAMKTSARNKALMQVFHLDYKHRNLLEKDHNVNCVNETQAEDWNSEDSEKTDDEDVNIEDNEGAGKFYEDKRLSLATLDDLSKRLSRLETNCMEKCGLLSEMSRSDADVNALVKDSQRDVSSNSSISLPSPLETEEWLAFLQQSIEEVMGGDLESVSQKSFVTMVAKALISHGAACRVTEYITSLLSLPFVLESATEPELAQIRQVYLEVRVISNLVKASKLLLNPLDCSSDEHKISKVFPHGFDVAMDNLQAIESVYHTITYLVYSDNAFLVQFCESVIATDMISRLQFLLTLRRRKLRIVTSLVAIFYRILLENAENSNLVEIIVLGSKNAEVELRSMLTDGSDVLRTRTCALLQLISCFCSDALLTIWSHELQNDIESLAYDSCQSVRLAAEKALVGLKGLPYYQPLKL